MAIRLERSKPHAVPAVSFPCTCVWVHVTVCMHVMCVRRVCVHVCYVSCMHVMCVYVCVCVYTL